MPQRSPLRYPGGKTWLVPHIRTWLRHRPKPAVLYEPFGGGGTVSLTAAAEDLAGTSEFWELDTDVAAFWRAALDHTDELCLRIERFDANMQNIREIVADSPADDVDRAFRTLVLNRTRRGGILASGTSFIRAGENRKGIASRWYPKTLVGRLRKIADCAKSQKLRFVEGDGMTLLSSSSMNDDVAVFVDPPYTVGRKRPGMRLYLHHKIDHERLFSVLSETKVDFLMTYNKSPDILDLIKRHRFEVVRVDMKTTHHTRVEELIVTPERLFHGF